MNKKPRRGTEPLPVGKAPTHPVLGQAYPRSIVDWEGSTYALLPASIRRPKLLAVVGDTKDLRRAESDTGSDGLALCPLSADNLQVLRQRLFWLRPRLLGQRTGGGCGDRLGLATPGHVRAVRGTTVVPVFAQQSVRENVRTGRTPRQVIDDAAWGILQEGWRELWGADADHLKTPEDIDPFARAGFSFYTIDPGAHVDNEAHDADASVLAGKWSALPWTELRDSPEAMVSRYLDRTVRAEDLELVFDRVHLQRAACKYGRALAHVAYMYGQVVERLRGAPFEVEVSVDETETPTSPLEHWFIASELKRLGVQWVSLAPRYVGRFEKGVDYIGSLTDFERDFAAHAAIARTLGPYKLSLHSGSDKFSIYPIAMRHTMGRVHLKTAGTSYLEALRTISSANPGLFREILDFGRGRYETDKVSYHVSADPARVPAAASLPDGRLPAVLEQFDGREVLHVTFGSVLERFGLSLKETLTRHEELYYTTLQAHFERHLAPFSKNPTAQSSKKESS
jgi:hypothetical protein